LDRIGVRELAHDEDGVRTQGNDDRPQRDGADDQRIASHSMDQCTADPQRRPIPKVDRVDLIGTESFDVEIVILAGRPEP
jgi:hypothetical protein